eukprot:749273-Hanusia_phi.AAC.6
MASPSPSLRPRSSDSAAPPSDQTVPDGTSELLVKLGPGWRARPRAAAADDPTPAGEHHKNFFYF